jgi:flagellin
MALSINTNTGAILAAVAAKRASEQMDEAMTRLSTGKRINSAKDDPGAMQVAVRMEAEINGLMASLRNANDAQAAIDTGESALSEAHTLLLRMRELAVSASSDSSTTADRTALNTEVTALEDEIDRIGTSTTWGGINLLDGTFTTGAAIVFQIGPRDGNTLSFSMGHLHATTSGTATDGELGLNSDVTSRSNATAYITTIDGAISIVSALRGKYGAVSNRLDSTISNLQNMKANLETAHGQVVDADFAVETAKLARAQILMQAATAMLSQANASKQTTLKLITG